MIGFNLIDRQRLELENAAAAYQRAREREERILRGGADENDAAVFHVGQEHVLLRAVEAMDFVDEQQRALASRRHQIAGFVEHLAQFFHAAGDGAHLPEFAAAGGGEQMRERGFAGAGRTVKNDRPQTIGRQQSAEQLAFAKEMFLSDEFIQRGRAHAGCQRLRLAAIFCFGGGEEGHVERRRQNYEETFSLIVRGRWVSGIGWDGEAILTAESRRRSERAVG